MNHPYGRIKPLGPIGGASDGIPPGNQVCTGLPAGGSRIRTIGPAKAAIAAFIPPERC
jgi:hypothetical protein